MSEELDKLLDHDYDGIKELDNNLPRWWLYLFYVTTVWAVLYLLYYHVFGIGYSQDDQYRAEVNPTYVRVNHADTKLLGVLPSYHSPLFNPKGDPTPRVALLEQEPVVFVEQTAETDTVTYAALTEAGDVTAGQELFIKNCTQCHGMAGEGGIGPNLTDQYWLHGGQFTNIVKSIKYGYPVKGMISWRGFLKPDQIMQVASFISTLKGTDPPNPKAPQGELEE